MEGSLAVLGRGDQAMRYVILLVLFMVAMVGCERHAQAPTMDVECHQLSNYTMVCSSRAGVGLAVDF